MGSEYPRDDYDRRAAPSRYDDQYSARDDAYSRPSRRYEDEESYAPPRRRDEPAYDREYEPSERSYASDRHGRGSVAEGPRGNELARYDDEKAYAEWQRGEDERSLDYRRGPPQDDYYEEERPRHGHHRDDRYDDRYDDRRSERGLDRRYDEPRGEKKNDLLPTLAGGAGGAFLGHELIGKGPLGTIGGAVVGAVAARAFEHHEEKKHREREVEEERRHRRREYDDY